MINIYEHVNVSLLFKKYIKLQCVQNMRVQKHIQIGRLNMVKLRIFTRTKVTLQQHDQNERLHIQTKRVKNNHVNADKQCVLTRTNFTRLV